MIYKIENKKIYWNEKEVGVINENNIVIYEDAPLDAILFFKYNFLNHN